MRVSVIVPAYNCADQLAISLNALASSDSTPIECIVVDDGSTDGTQGVATSAGATVVCTGSRSGPARARNLGAQAASGDLLVFVDADVAIHPDALGRIAARFEEDPNLDALMGSYDDAPAHPGFVSQFKNLMHSFVHHQGKERASTFWCGCSAVKRSVYMDHGGLDESYLQPSIEDIEFGFRMVAASRKIVLDSRIQGKHLKQWTFWGLVHTDIFKRGIPWTELILRTGFLPNDLNLSWSQRVASAFAGLSMLFGLLWIGGIIAGAAAKVVMALGLATVLSVAVVAIINRQFYEYLASRRGWTFSVRALPMHILYYVYSFVSLLLGAGLYAIRRMQGTRHNGPRSQPEKPRLTAPHKGLGRGN